MNEAKYRYPRLEPIGLEHPYALELDAIGLAVVGNDHADIMTVAGQSPGQQRLLNRFPADRIVSEFGGEGRQIVQADKADLHAGSSVQAVARL